MIDAALYLTPEGVDMQLDGGDLLHENGLATAVLQSLFCDARASDEEALAEGIEGLLADRRGWWGDVQPDRYGSKLWLLERAKPTDETRLRADRYAKNALAWLVDEGIASRADATATYDPTGLLCIAVVLDRGTSRRWQHVWDGLEAQLVAAGVLQLVQAEASAGDPTLPPTHGPGGLGGLGDDLTVVPKIGGTRTAASFGGLSVSLTTSP